ncbi:hypothetical protein [Actinomyces haliotis]|uniref:hypothetical protein n=1 Tax=Actinomyces haliotis TaxID=1280843 RepID=UPI00188E987B|nr:hypothetical protein [Actinomyces haliotis]
MRRRRDGARTAPLPPAHRDGGDASDTAFLTVSSGAVDLGAPEVSAVIDPALPDDDLDRLVRLR